MIVATEFPGDANEILKQVQHDAYWEIIGYLYAYSRERYLGAARLLGIENEFVRLIRENERFDHRVLQAAHDLVATRFRFTRPNREQISLPFSPDEYKQRLKEEWTAFFKREAEELANNDETNREILGCVAYSNSEIGMKHEEWLARLLEKRYDVTLAPFPPFRLSHATRQL
jgi:hypothetical protein